MANKLATVTGNFLTAGTWVSANTGANGSLISTSTSVTALTTGNLDSTAGALAAQASQYLAVRLGTRASGSPTNKMTVKLRNSTSGTDIWTFVINVSDLFQATAANDDGGWYVFKAAASHTPNGTDNYVIRMTLDSTSTAVSMCTNGTANNWQHVVYQTATGAPAAADDMFVCGVWDTTNPAVKTDVVVTMNETATTDYGSANTNARIPAMAIGKGGTLRYAITASTNFNLRLSGHLIVYGGGAFDQGRSGANVIPRSSSGQLEMDCAADLNWGVIIRNGGTRNFYGESRLSGVSNVFTLLNADAAAAATSLTTTTQLSAANGDDVGIGGTNSSNRTQTETKALTADAGATSLTIAAITNAHNGDNSEQGLIISLTRNARVVGTNSSFMTFETWQPGAICNASWASWRYCGQGTTYGLGIQGTNQTVDSCAFRESDGDSLGIVSTSVGASVTNCVGYNAATGWTVEAGATTVTINGLYGMINTNTAAPGMVVEDLASMTQLDNLWAVGYTTGCQLDINNNSSATSGTGRTFSNWTFNSNTNGLVIGNVAQPVSGPYTFASLRIWRNTTIGLVLTAARSLTFTDLWAWNNDGTANATNVQFIGGACSDIKFTDHRNAGAAAGGGLSIVASALLTDVSFYGGKWGSTGGGIFAANSSNRDVFFPANANNQNYYEIFFNNCTFDQSTASSWHNSTSSNKGSIFRFMSRNGNANEHLVDRYGYGTVTYETTTVDSSPSFKLTPTSGTVYKHDSSAGIPDWGFYVPVDNGQAPSISIKIQKDGSYTGNAPRLMVRRNDSIGITADTLVATFSGSSGSWVTVSGSAPTATAKGVMVFYVDCDGSAGNVFGDTFTVASAGADALSGLSYWHGGLPC